jgi:hypothetical protein
LHTRDFLYIRNYKPELSPAAADPQRAAFKEKLARQLDAELMQTGDPRATGHGHVFDSYPDRSPRQGNPLPRASSKLP